MSQPADRSAIVDDVHPFSIDPLLYSQISKWNWRPVPMFYGLIVLFTFALTWAASLGDLMFSKVGFFDVLSGYLQGVPAEPRLPLASDWMSILLALLIASAVAMVYGLLRLVDGLHSSLLETGALQFESDDVREEFNGHVEWVNQRFQSAGRLSAIILGALLIAVWLINASQGGKLLWVYDAQNWWGSTAPLRLGGGMWSVMGAIGLYAVYCQSVLGVIYMRFLGRIAESCPFGVNPYSPDGLWGWGRLRKILAIMEVGIVVTALACFGLWPFLEAAMGVFPAAGLEAAFISLVAYVYFTFTSRLREMAQADRKRRILRWQNGPVHSVGSANVAAARLAQLRELDFLQLIPRSPLRRTTLVLPAMSLAVPILQIGLTVFNALKGP